MNTLKPFLMSTVLNASAIAATVAVGLASPDARAADPASIALKGCNESNVLLMYPSALYQNLLPPGFTFPAPTALAPIEVGGASCTTVGSGGAGSALLAFLEVVPPPELADPNVGLYAIALTSYSTSAEFVNVFAAAGFGDSVKLGSVKVTTMDHPLIHERTGTTVAGDANGQVITSTTVFGPLETVPAARTRLFAVKDGKVVGIADGTYNDHAGWLGIGALLKFGDSTQVLPATAFIGSHELNFDLTVTAVPLPTP